MFGPPTADIGRRGRAGADEVSPRAAPGPCLAARSRGLARTNSKRPDPGRAWLIRTLTVIPPRSRARSRRSGRTRWEELQYLSRRSIPVTRRASTGRNRRSSSSTCSLIRRASASMWGTLWATSPPTSTPATCECTGHNVIHPMGYDAFGLPAEQYAIQTGQHPRDHDRKEHRDDEACRCGAWDWVTIHGSLRWRLPTCPSIEWTQWIFLQLVQRLVRRSSRIAPDRSRS